MPGRVGSERLTRSDQHLQTRRGTKVQAGRVLSLPRFGRRSPDDLRRRGVYPPGRHCPQYSHILAGFAVHVDDPTRSAFVAWNESVQRLMTTAAEKGQCQELEIGISKMNAKQGDYFTAANRAANETPESLT